MTLSLAAELDLCRRAQAGDRVARDQMVAHSLPWVRRFAVKATRGTSYDVEDAYSEGCLALLESLEPGRFDPSRGLRLITYASHRVRRRLGEMKLRENTAHSGRSGYELRHQSAEERGRDRGRYAFALVMCDLQREYERVTDVSSASLDGQSSPLARWIRRLRDDGLVEDPEALYLDALTIERMLEALEALPDLEQRALAVEYCSEERPRLAEVAAALGVSIAEARAVRDRALKTMRAKMGGVR